MLPAPCSVKRDIKRHSQLHTFLPDFATQVPLSPEERQKQLQTPEKLAIGGDGGFQVDSPADKTETKSELVLLDANIRIPLPCPDLPELIINVINAIQVTHGRTCISSPHVHSKSHCTVYLSEAFR